MASRVERFLGYNQATGLLDDQSFLVRTETNNPPTPGGDSQLRRDSLIYRRFTTDGTELPPFGTFPGTEVFWQADGTRRTLLQPLGFGRSFELATGNSLVYLGQTDSYEIRAYTHAGQLRQTLRVNLDAVPVTGAMIAAFKEHDLELYGDSALIAGFRRLREAMPYPATAPAFSALAVDWQQNLWVRTHPLYPDSSTTWHVFSPAGRLSGRVELPASFEPKIFADTIVMGVWTDADDVEHLRSYRLERRPQQ
jgi:hypothetical protein